MKKIFSLLIALSLLLSLCACGEGAVEEESGEDTTAAAPSWKNSIEYEGFFYVSEEVKLLYAQDFGKVTLWDNDGNGKVLQELEYDSSEADVFDRFEFEDFNGDGYTDIRAPFGTLDSNEYYNLWLWNDLTYNFIFCAEYQETPNPVHEEDGSVTSVIDKGPFGIVTLHHKFDEGLNFVIDSVETEDMNAIAEDVASALLSAEGVEASLIRNKTINGMDCTILEAKKGGETVAYIAYSEDSTWFIDTTMATYADAFRKVLAEGDKILSGAYVDSAYYAESAMLAKNKSEAENITDAWEGDIDGHPAKFFMFDNGYIAVNENSRCYFSEDGISFTPINYTSGLLSDTSLVTVEPHTEDAE